MAWKDILVFADGSEAGLTRVKIARDIARVHEAHLEIHGLTLLPPRPYGPTTGSLEDAYRRVCAAAEHGGKDVLAAFEKIAPPGAHASAYQDVVTFAHARAIVASAGRSADLVVFGQPDGETAALDAEILMGAVFGAGQPCLMLPRWIEPHPWGRRALLAWKGTPQAARAMHAALPLLQRAESVRLVVVDAAPELAGEDRRSLLRIVTHLQRHSVAVEDPVVVQSSFDQVGRAIAGQIEEFGADLLVMGAYGHGRAREFVFGGVSRDMIRDARIPVLLTH